MARAQRRLEVIPAHHDERLPTREVFRWRPWPCGSCCGATTPFDYLGASVRADGAVSRGQRNRAIEDSIAQECRLLQAWVASCPHTIEEECSLRVLAEGSEHRVYFDEAHGEVRKVTLYGTYGEYYELIDGRIVQFSAAPSDYFIRMQAWQRLFSLAPEPLGLTERGQIVSRQLYAAGKRPTQEQVDEFLVAADLVPVRKECWIWKKAEPELQIETWIGDVRADNFVATSAGVVPIDIRIWQVEI